MDVEQADNTPKKEAQPHLTWTHCQHMLRKGGGRYFRLASTLTVTAAYHGWKDGSVVPFASRGGQVGGWAWVGCPPEGVLRLTLYYSIVHRLRSTRCDVRVYFGGRQEATVRLVCDTSSGYIHVLVCCIG